jgi:thioredoxin 2
VRTVAERIAGEAAVVQVNSEDNPSLSARFGVRGIPLLLLLRSGSVVDRLPGAQTAEAVVAWFHRHR